MYAGFYKDLDIDMEFVDAICVVDDKCRIVYSVRYNPRFDDNFNEREFSSLINKNLFEVYPSVNPRESTIMKCLEKGIPIYNKKQIFTDFQGRVLNTQNLTIPIMKMGKVLGAIELSKDITKIRDLSEEYSKVTSVEIDIKRAQKNQNESTSRFNFDDIITKNEYMLDNIEKAKLIAEGESAVLVYGETGTGKELFVQSIHNSSQKRKGAFIAQNCAALPESLFESLLFGSAKGAFTGAVDKAGLFEMAHGGTLFLDEINSMPLNLQTKLLRVIQDGCVRRIGDTKDKKLDVRIIAAMNVNPKEAISKKQIREDLYYRLNVNSIKLTPLRARKEDIPVLIECFIKKYEEKNQKKIKGIDKETENLFDLYDWPGNVRELQHVIEGALNIARDEKIGIKHLPVYLSDDMIYESYDDEWDLEELRFNEIKPLNEIVDFIEKKMIIRAIRKCGNNISKASKLLKVPRQTLQYKINKYEIKVED